MYAGPLRRSSFVGFVAVIQAAASFDGVVKAFIAFRLTEELGQTPQFFGYATAAIAAVTLAALLFVAAPVVKRAGARDSLVGLVALDAVALFGLGVLAGDSAALTVAFYALHCVAVRLGAVPTSIWTAAEAEAGGGTTAAYIALQKIAGSGGKMVVAAVAANAAGWMGICPLYAASGVACAGLAVALRGIGGDGAGGADEGDGASGASKAEGKQA